MHEIAFSQTLKIDIISEGLNPPPLVWGWLYRGVIALSTKKFGNGP